jgi:hypothetical protein
MAAANGAANGAEAGNPFTLVPTNFQGLIRYFQKFRDDFIIKHGEAYSKLPEAEREEVTETIATYDKLITDMEVKSTLYPGFGPDYVEEFFKSATVTQQALEENPQ